MKFETKKEEDAFLENYKKEHESELPVKCSDFCPLGEEITKYNNSHYHNIYCATEMCECVMNAYILNKIQKEEEQKKE